MKKYLFLFLMMALAGSASAASLTVSWVLPTTGAGNVPLTGSNAITNVQVFVSTSPIPNNSAGAPLVVLSATSTTTTQTVTASPGQTLYARIKVCNQWGCSAYSAEASKVVPGPTPNIPTDVTITITIE